MSLLNTNANFENFVAECNNAKTVEDLYQTTSKSLNRLGYDKVIFSIIKDLDVTPEGRTVGVFNNYPEDWQKYYAEMKFDQIDPVIKYAAVSSEPFRWKDLHKKIKMTAKQKKVLQLGEDAGLQNGIVIPIRGNRAQLSGLGLASTEKIDACDVRLDIVNAHCQQFFLSYKRLFSKNEVEEEILGDTLTQKEAEILTWAAIGKTDEEIATILSISRHTVDTHMRHIFRKLDATNRIQGVVKAITQGLINP